MPAWLMVSSTLDWVIMYTKIGGIIIITVTAMALPLREMPLEVMEPMTLGRVFRLSEKMELPD
jgi:hypothetical protein